ncbi:hypothetical protein N7509_003636 [Penicillium cosmopolitanum]|uniref:vesicle-fusing ATPase n=1 Tax=Penicillium cosmopolitanum TaxID=1131564 RepID=A0A9X0BBK0_9EURO|nr:uncharacterized protein N7509_003636 [Penicillium cosmopolitanum]KAJ5403765.1 hypothetical protein N7509_003636 [Penicillium cosmopolitanum]
MDPLSIASASGSLAVLCVRVATAIHDITSSIQNVDENLSSLRQELLGLSGVLEGIENTWKKNHSHLVAYSGADANLWSSISDNVSSGRETVAKLEKAFAKVTKTGSFSNSFLRKPVKAFKLSLSSDDISQYRQRINSHQLAMQSGLQMIILCLQIQETTSTQNMDTSLSTLGVMINAITKRLETLTTKMNGPGASSISLGSTGKDGVIFSLQNMAQAAKSLYSSASTVIEGKRSTVYDGSILGDPLTEEQSKYISDWIPPTKDDIPEKDTPSDAAPAAVANIDTSTRSEPKANAIASTNLDFLSRAIDTVKKAIEYDNKGEYESAYKNYYAALELFMLAVKWEKNPQAKERIRNKVGEYMARAEKLKSYLDSQKSSRNSSTVTASTSTAASSNSSSTTATTASTTTLVATRLPFNPGTPHVLPIEMSSKLFVNYIAETEDITGAENVQIVTSNDTLCRNISKALDALCIPPLANLFLSAVIAPRTVEDVQGLLRLFHRIKIPVWPFYSTEEEDLRHVIPRVPGSIGLDLAKYMKNIVEVNEDHLYAIVEPGVSYAALARDISQRGLDDRFWIDWPSSSRELIIDHVLESESAAGSCGMEIILPKGDILQTGVLNSHKERGLPKDRTLEQGLVNGLIPVQCLGVISKILRSKASEGQPFLITFSRSDHFRQIIDVARKLHLSGLIHHDLRLRHILLESEVLSQVSSLESSSPAQALHLDYWNLYGVLSQPKPLRALTWETIKKSFEDEAMEAIKFHLSDEYSPQTSETISKNERALASQH